MRLSKNKKIDGLPIYEPPQGGCKFTFAPILDSNSGLTDSGDFVFEVIKTRRSYNITYASMSLAELQYMLGLVYDAQNRPKEFRFTCDHLGGIVSFGAYLGSNVSYDTVIEGKRYKNVTFNISETRN